jgi:hypothetical protein
VVQESVTVNNLPAGSSNSLRAVCPSGYKVIAGGFAGTPGQTQGYQSYPVASIVNGPLDAWRAAYVNPTNAPASGGFSTYAICVLD